MPPKGEIFCHAFQHKDYCKSKAYYGLSCINYGRDIVICPEAGPCIHFLVRFAERRLIFMQVEAILASVTIVYSLKNLYL